MSTVTLKHDIIHVVPLVCLMFISSGAATAEMGIGIVEDRITRIYREEVYKDWQEGIVVDSNSGNYIVTYKTDDGSFAEVIMEPATKISPVLKSEVRLSENSIDTTYQFKLKNGAASKQNIRAIRTEITSATPNSVVSSDGWGGGLYPNPQMGLAMRLSWSYIAQVSKESKSGLSPGKSLRGFRFESMDLPGVGIIRIEGAATQTTWLGHIPEIDSPVGTQINNLRLNDFVPNFAALPRIPVPTPFNAAAVLGGVQKHIKEDLVSMKLIDPVLASQLDRLLQAAIDAAKINNTTAVRSNLKDLRKLLKKEHEDVDSEDDKDFDKDDANETRKSALIDRLTARVLDFDLKYVEKRVKEDKD